MTITIKRGSPCGQCIIGELYVDDNLVCNTLEIMDGMVPNGIYSAFIRTDGFTGWMIDVLDVYGSTRVVLLGNYHWARPGCTKVGRWVNTSNCTLSENDEAMDYLDQALSEFQIDLIRFSDIASDKYSIQVKYV